jgi:Xaa-Pro dipeptidase
MAVTHQQVSLTSETVERIRAELREKRLGGWLLYDFHGSNRIASQLLGLPPMTRRYLVLIPAEGPPVALIHRIEQQPWQSWIGERRVYAGWRELEEELRGMLAGLDTLALEYSPENSVPYVDLVPAGAVELIRRFGTELRSSAELISAFYSRWSATGVAAHRRAAAAVRDTAIAAFERAAAVVGEGESISEWELRQWIVGELTRRRVSVACDSIVAVTANAANPHYAPAPSGSARLSRGDLLLIDLWGKEPGDAVFADQTWMGYLGEAIPVQIATIWAAVREARDRAVEFLRQRHREGRPTSGGEVDDVARGVITRHGFGEHFVHRTGHSIDRELHGSGPNLDNLETRDTRELIPGVGFSVEPGIYLTGEVGCRTEINVFMGPDGPEVSPPEPQQQIFTLLSTG